MLRIGGEIDSANKVKEDRFSSSKQESSEQSSGTGSSEGSSGGSSSEES